MPRAAWPAPGTALLDQGHHQLAEANYDRLRRNAQGLDLPVRSTKVEMGPSQFEFTFDPASALEHADTMVMFRTLMKEVC